MHKTKPIVALVVVLASLAAAWAATAAVASSTRAAASSQTYSDAVGDAQSAPDISGITVSNDDNGLVTIDIAFANRPQLNPGELAMGVFSTGEKTYVSAVNATGYVLLAELVDGNLQQTSLPSFSGRYSGGEAVFTVNVTDLGDTRALMIGAGSGAADGTADWAPDEGLWPYTVVISSTGGGTTTGELEIADDGLVLGKAKAGKPFKVQTNVSRVDTGEPVDGHVSCKARFGNKAIAGRGRSQAGVATCAYQLPKKAKGKQLSGSMGVSYGTASLSESFSIRVK